jgi:hypothetical protein
LEVEEEVLEMLQERLEEIMVVAEVGVEPILLAAVTVLQVL